MCCLTRRCVACIGIHVCVHNGSINTGVTGATILQPLMGWTGIIPGVLFLICWKCNRFVLWSTIIAIGLRACIIKGVLVILGIVIMDELWITLYLCSCSVSWAMFLSTLCSSTRGTGLKKESILAWSKRNKRFPFLVAHVDMHSVNSLVSAQKCWLGIKCGSWKCCGKISVNPKTR